MTRFDEHTLEVLEYPKIIALLQGQCLTSYGMAEVARFAPVQDLQLIQTRMTEIAQMKDIIRFGEAFPLYRLEDIREIIARAKAEGIFIEPAEMLKVRELIEVGGGLNGYAKDERDRFPAIAGYLEKIHPFPEIRKEIVKAIDHNGSVLDSASSELKKIRIEIGESRRKIINRLERILADRHKSPGWQDDMVTQRDGRYVIPVISGQFRSDSGIIHDRSQSGATLYVEPTETVELNNQLGLLLQDERLEIDRILRHITAMIGAAADRLLQNCEIIGHLDAIHAASLFAIKTDSNRPTVSGKSHFSLRNARHPLLLYYATDKNTIIPSDLSLGNGRQAIIITGPNTGGKTVLLKTVGLLVLMAQTGLHLPADEPSEIGLFKNIFADIGDEQSIELSLSTFSSHIRQIIYAVRHSGPDSLALFDEIGAGTDPKEGAALAEGILLKMVSLGTLVIVTTHYSQLKTLPMHHPEIENASFEFDRESLQPTFRLLTGIPGSSYAVEIARRLGLPSDIADTAMQLLGKGERSLSGLIESLEKELATLKKDKVSLEERLKSAAQLEEFYRRRLNQLEQEIEKSKMEHLEELQKLLGETRLEVERLVKSIRESNASQETVKTAHKFLKTAADRAGHLQAKHFPQKKTEETLSPGDRVTVNSLRAEGELIEITGSKARVRIGNLLSTVELSDLKKITEYSQAPAVNSTVNLRDLTAPGPELHLRGMTIEEAREALDKFLDSAIISGMKQIYVVHGKGTGALRKALSQFLKEHPTVESFRLGDWNEGGAGVTVVTLK